MLVTDAGKLLSNRGGSSIVPLPEGGSCRIVPFENARERAIHFAKHGHKFQSVDELDYERMADLFMYGTMPPDVQQCHRPHGRDRLRIEHTTAHFGVACVVPSFVRTFYPASAGMLSKRGGTHGFFQAECNRIL